MSDQEPVGESVSGPEQSASGDEQGSDAGAVDESAVDQTEPTIEFSASAGDEAEAPDIAVDSEEDA